MEAASGVSHTCVQQSRIKNSLQQRIKPISPQKSKAKWRCVTPSDFSYINKYKPKMLTAIHFTRIESEHTKTSRVRNLRLAMMSNKRLSTLIFDEHVANQLPQLLSSTTHWQKIEFLNETGRFEARGREDSENLLKLKKCRDLSVLKISYAARTILFKATMLSRLSDELKWLRKLKVLDLNLLDYHHTANALLLDPNAAILKFKPPKSLVSFRLNFEASTLDSELLREFTSNVQKCFRLQDLKLIFGARVDNITVSEAQIWISFFKKMGHLKAFTFQRPFLSDQEFKGSQMFLEGFEHFKNLETLNLSLHGLMDDNPPILLTKAFYLHLASLPRLKSLFLALHGKNFAQAGNFQGITKNIQLLTHLKELDIRLQNHGLPFIDNSFFKAFALAILHLKKLEHIKLFFKRQKTTPEAILSLVQSLQQLPRLKTLDINPDLEQKSLEHLSNLMTNISLSSFSLTSHKFIKARPSLISSFMNLWKKQTSINPFFSALENLNSLSSLSLNLYALTISNEELNHLSLALKQLENLSSLSLKVPQFDPQNDYEGLRSLLTVPGQMKNLNSLDLTINGDFYGAKISLKEINLIASSIEQWKSLESLRISFMSMQKSWGGDNLMSQLSKGMAELTKLKLIEVRFFLTVSFENNMIRDLLAKLTPLKDLETLILNYCRPNDGTFDISSMCLKEKNSFRRLERLILDHHQYSISYQN